MPISLVVPGLAAGVGVRLSPDGATAYYVEWSIGRLCKADVASGAVTVTRNAGGTSGLVYSYIAFGF